MKNLLHIGISIAAVIIIIAGIATIRHFEDNADKTADLTAGYPSTELLSTELETGGASANEKNNSADLALAPVTESSESTDALNETSDTATAPKETGETNAESSPNSGPKENEAVTENESMPAEAIKPIEEDQDIVMEVKEEAVEDKAGCSGGDLSADFLCLINDYRVSQGKNRLAYSGALNSAALAHSKWMTTSGNFSHTGENGTSFSERCSAAGTACDAENLAFGAGSASELFEMWKASAIHNKNMLGSHTVIGLGRDGSYTTLLFY